MMRARQKLGRWSGSMRNAWRAVFVVAGALLPAAVHAQPYVTARGAIIVDADSGAVIWESNADEPLPPASTTKVMTAILALQSHQLDDHFSVSANAAATPPSKIGLRTGQSVALRDLLYAVLLKSANDAAVVVAEGVAGSEYAFADRMNLKARVIGASQTNFVNPHGLTEHGHGATARDLSRIFRYGLGVPGFREVLSTPAAEVPIDNPDGAERLALVRSHNRLLDFQVIGKTGYTRPARRCFVGAAGQGSREVVIAILGSNDLWGDARRMLDYGLSPSRPMPVLMAAASPPPPPVPVLEAAPPPVVAVARAEPSQPTAELRAAPPPEPARPVEVRAAPPPEPARPVGVRAAPPPQPGPPVEVVGAEAASAPEAALARATRMARAQQEVIVPAASETARGDDEPSARRDDDARRDAAPSARPEPSRQAPPSPAPIRAVAQVAEPSRIAPPQPEPERTEPSRADSPSEDAATPRRTRRETIVPSDREAARGAHATTEPSMAPDEPSEPAAERESPHGGVWADSPIRNAGDEKRAARPAREIEDDQEPGDERPVATGGSRRHTPASRASKDEETATATRDDTRRTAKGADVDARHHGRSAKTAQDRAQDRAEERRQQRLQERREELADARAQTAKSRRHLSKRELREERRRGVTLIRADESDERPSRKKGRADEDEPSKASSPRRSGRHSPEGDVDDGRRGARDGGKSQNYTVQLGPFRTRKAVDSARADLSKLGYEARVVGQNLQLGNFSDRSRADRLASRLRVTGHPATSTALR